MGVKEIEDAVFVVGHPRSGTSLVCQLVESAGVEFLSNVESDPFNKNGYYELLSNNKLCRRLIDEAMTEENTRDMNIIIDRLNTGNIVKGLKVIFIPALFFYKYVTDNMRVIFVYRDPSDVKSSMLNRGISQFHLSLFENNNALIAGYENIKNSILIKYSDMFNKQDIVEKKLKSIGLDVNMNIVDKEQWNQEGSHIVNTEKEDKLYRVIRGLDRREGFQFE